MTFRVLRLVGLGVLTLFAISVVVFGVTRALPGDVATQILGTNATPEKLAQIRSELGIDRPIVVQYLNWFTSLLRGDFGVSLSDGQPISQVMGPRFANTALLAGFAFAVTVPLSLLLGTYAAVNRDGWFDRALVILTTIASGIPEFVLGILLVAVVTFGGLGFIPSVSNLDPTVSVWSQLDMLILPVVTLVISATPLLARMVRSTLAEQLDSEYVAMGRLNGLPERTLIFRQALPNTLPALIQVLALLARYLIAGVVMVEIVFSYPGLGSALISAVTLRDLTTVQFIAITFAATIVIANILADVAATLATPKLRAAR